MRASQQLLAVAVIGVLVFAATGAVRPAAAASDNQVLVSKTASPADIFVQGAGSPDSTQVTLTVQGFGGTLTETVPIDVVFAIDSSGSMTINDPSNLRIAAAKSFVDKLNSTRDQGGVVSWDDNVDFAFGLTQDFGALKTNINSVDASGGTNLNAGLNGAISMLDGNTRSGSSTEVIIFLTDGVGTYTPAGSGGPAANAAGKGYKIYSIALGGASTGPLTDMASATGGQFFNAPSAANLDAIFNAILQQIVINTAPFNVNLVETTQDYIVDESSFSIAPDSIVTLPGGQTQITWNNVAQHVGDGDNKLLATETFAVTFDASSTLAGNNLPVDDLAESHVQYTNPDGTPGTADIPQAFINVQGPPVAVDDSANTLEDTPVTIGVLANDSDPNGDALTVISVSPPAQGTAVINGDGTITYTPDPSIFGASDTFTYTIDDGHGLTDTATVTVNVQGLTSTPGKVTGGQANLDNNTNAGFNVQSGDGTTFKGQLQFNDKLEDIKLHSQSMTALAIDPTGTTATFKGTAEVNGVSGYTFKAIVKDNGEPGTNDSFLIVIKDLSNTTIYMRGGTLSGGNIQIH
ncbi:Mg-chelatase subunit ChlD [Candidatus Nitrososphaera evergladensis SR1]|jgi:Ca-activated chloride channel family protein|uniref:Mg-chelatase subunit ChlD n=1 Tax=Candidatus Nitrososphaera evergladensis SR1 TaxID=1459636 RepID=A0A075MSH7_9ARCH|nr:Ig-like domain-containing protein [Candidatus Nitrososphaera evergladensis]AIF84113.1 Mg-chelatase subunit ChlD [Candidatus Nitrososphaera evergladensis SR1]